MAIIQFDNGQKVKFNGTPTAKDVEEVAIKLGIQKKKSTLQKAGDISGKALGGLYKFSGMEAAGKLVGSAAEGFGYGLAKLTGDEDIAQERLDNPLSSIQKKAKEKGTKSALKDVAGSTLEAGLSAGAFLTGGGASKVVTKPILGAIKGGAKIGGGFGAGFGLSSALQDDKSLNNTVKDTAASGAMGAVAGAVISGGIAAASIGGKNLVNRAKKYSQDMKNSLGKYAQGKLESTSKELVKMSPSASAKEAKWGKNSPKFIANEYYIDEKTLKPRSILELIDKDGKYLVTDEAVSRMRMKYSEESKIFQTLLKDSGEYASLDKLGKEAIESLGDKYLAKGTDYNNAIKQINKEINAYKANYASRGLADGSDVLVKIADLNQIKSGLWSKTSNFNPSQTDKLLSDVNYRMGQVAKDMIENSVDDVAVKSINQRLGDFASAIKVLENANGKVVPGGFFGKQFTRIAGTIAGSGGGLPGSVIGNVTGGALADVMANPKIKTSIWAKLVRELNGTVEGRNIIKEANEILIKRGNERASRLLLEAPKTIILKGKSDTSGLLTQDEANIILDAMKIKTPLKSSKGSSLPKGKGETLKSSVSNFTTKAYKEAPLAKTEIDTIASTLAKKYKGKVALAPLKKEEKVIFNIKNKYNGDYSRVSDIARNTIIVSPEDAPKVFKELQKNPNYFSGKFVDPKTDLLGYSGYNTKYRASNGHIAEIQINTPEMIYAKEPAESAIKQLGNKLYNQLNKQYNGTGGKGHLYYDKWAKALSDGDFKLAQNIQKNSTNYYRPFISRPKIDFTKPGSFAIFRKKDSNFMIASAENPMGTVISNKENIARTKAFRKFLDDNYISYHEQLGKYGGNAEASNLIEITNPKQRILVDKWLAKNSPQAENIIIKDGKAVRYDPRTNEAYQVDLTKYKGQLRRDDLADDFYSEIAGKKYALPLYDDTIEKTLDKNNFIKYYNN